MVHYDIPKSFEGEPIAFSKRVQVLTPYLIDRLLPGDRYVLPSSSRMNLRRLTVLLTHPQVVPDETAWYVCLSDVPTFPDYTDSRDSTCSPCRTRDASYTTVRIPRLLRDCHLWLISFVVRFSSRGWAQDPVTRRSGDGQGQEEGCIPRRRSRKRRPELEGGSCFAFPPSS